MSLHPFDSAVNVEPVEGRGDEGTTLLRGHLDRGWWVQRGPNGGYAAALMLSAMQSVAGDRPPRSLTVQYPKAPVEGECEIEVTTIRQGRTVTFLSARMLQNSATLLTALCVFGDRRETTIEYEGKAAVMPDVDSPDELVPIPGGRLTPPVVENFDFQLAIGETPLRGSDVEAITGGWIRLREPRLVDAQLATAILDVWLPAPFLKLEAPVPAPTLDFTVHFRQELPLAGAVPEDPYLLQVHSDLSRHGYFEEDAALWHPNGTLIAHSRQLALI